jgi:hypothetical protein
MERNVKIFKSRFCFSLIILASAFSVVFQLSVFRPSTVQAQATGRPAVAQQYPNFTVDQRRAILQAVQSQRHSNFRKLSVWEALQRFLATPASVQPTAAPASANFAGNLTTINAGAGNAMGMVRTATCSLTAYSASYTIGASTVSATLLGQTSNYDQLLHNEAGLTTTGGTWPAGCGNQTLGVTAQQVVYLGETTAGYGVLAGAFDSQEIEAVSLDLSGGTGDASVSNLTDGATPTLLAAADLNKDGNSDLVAVNQPAAAGSSASISVFVANANGTFQSAVNYALPETQGAGAVIDDFNGDGIPDIVASSYTESTSGGQVTFHWQLTFFAGKGDGTFQTAQTVTVTPPASITTLALAYTGMISADIRGNGTKDLVTADGIILFGNGNGTFTQVAVPAFPNTPSGSNIAAADFNNDGKLDLAVNNVESISIYLGNGTGAFTAGGSYATIDNADYLSASDLDGDGGVDLYTGLSRDGLFGGDQFAPGLGYALMGHGDGSFAGAPVLPFVFTGANLTPLKTGNTTLTGFAINSTLNSTNVSITAYTLKSNGTFSTGPTTTLSPVTIGGTPYSFQGFTSFGFGDFNSDGNTDMILVLPGPIANGLAPYWGFMLATGKGDGTFNNPVLVPLPNFVVGGANDDGANVSNLLVADVNGDGKPDLIYNYTDTAFATQVQYAGIAVQLSNGDGTFQVPQTIQTYSGTGLGYLYQFPILAYAGTAIQGGKADLFAVQSTAGTSGTSTKLLMYPGNGDGTFGAATTPPAADNFAAPSSGSVLSAIVLADMNGDGKPDLVTLGEANSGEQAELAISLGNGDGTFNSPTIVDFGNGLSLGDSLAVADFNGDGKLDVAVGGANPPLDTGIFFGNGDGTVQSFNAGNSLVEPAQAINLSGGGGQALVDDINGDGKPDLILGSVVLINNGVTTSSLTPTSTALTASATSIATGQSVTFTATVSASSTPSGTVTFYDGTTSLGEGTLNGSGVATYATTALSAGSHSITAAYGGNSTFAPSTSAATTVMVSTSTLAATTTTLTASTNSVGAGESVNFSATVTPDSGTGTPTGTVTFMNGTTAIGTGTLTGGAAGYSSSNLATGANSITAVYSGDSNFSSSTSTAVVVTVTTATPSFTIADSPASGTITAGQSAQTTITVTPAGGFNQQISFACAGLPTGAACSFSPANATPNGSAATTTLTIATTAQSSAVARPYDSRSHLRQSATAAFVVLAGGFFWLFRGYRRLSYWTGLQLGLMFLLTAAAILGCGGSSSSSGSGGTTQSQTYSVIITATAGSESQKATYSLTVQ